MSILPKLLRIISLLPVAMGLCGCSTVKLAYNNLDQVAYWWIDSYVDLTDDQSLRLRADVQRLHRWHRTTELPAIVATLQSIEQLAPSDFTPAQACGFEGRLRQHFNTVTEQAESAVVALATSLSPEQIARIERKFDAANRDYRHDWIEPEAATMRERRFDRMAERASMVYGNLEEKQQGALRAAIDRSIFDPKRVFHEQRRRQRDLLQVLRQIQGQPMPAADARALLRGFLQRAQESPDGTYRAYQAGLVQDTCTIVAAIHNSTTKAQRDLAARRLRAWQRDLGELAAQQ